MRLLFIQKELPSLFDELIDLGDFNGFNDTLDLSATLYHRVVDNHTDLTLDRELAAYTDEHVEDAADGKLYEREEDSDKQEELILWFWDRLKVI